LLFVTDAAGENTYVNRFYRDYTGVDQATSRKWWRGLIHPDDLELVMTTSQQARETGEDFRLDYRIRRHDGQFRWHSTKASPTIRPDGSIERWVGVSLDIHDRRVGEEQARLAAEEIAATYATAPIGLPVFDPELRYVRINDRLAEIKGAAGCGPYGQDAA
jgi:PAS domain S-box-containing protein